MTDASGALRVPSDGRGALGFEQIRDSRGAAACDRRERLPVAGGSAKPQILYFLLPSDLPIFP